MCADKAKTNVQLYTDIVRVKSTKKKYTANLIKKLFRLICNLHSAFIVCPYSRKIYISHIYKKFTTKKKRKTVSIS